jgi:hypothetical protein
MASTLGAVSPAQISVLRKLARDADFRAAFFKDPIRALGASNLGVTPAELNGLLKVTPQQIDGLQRAAVAVGGARADDNCTLVYALAFAIAFAVAFSLLETPSAAQVAE